MLVQLNAILAELLVVRASLAANHALPATITLGRILQRVVELMIEREETLAKGQ